MIIAVLLFGLVITIHEFGHFFTAKLCGIRVNEFAVGMGPQLVSFQRGETQYSLRLLPIGGYCAMEGEQEDSDDERAFNRKAVWKRILVVAMGAVMNIVLGLILMLIILLQTPLMGSNVVARFEEGSALQAAGIQVGDEITSIGGPAVCNGDPRSQRFRCDNLDYRSAGRRNDYLPGCQAEYRHGRGRHDEYCI